MITQLVNNTYWLRPFIQNLFFRKGSLDHLHRGKKDQCHALYFSSMTKRQWAETGLFSLKPKYFRTEAMTNNDLM